LIPVFNKLEGKIERERENGDSDLKKKVFFSKELKNRANPGKEGGDTSMS